MWCVERKYLKMHQFLFDIRQIKYLRRRRLWGGFTHARNAPLAPIDLRQHTDTILTFASTLKRGAPLTVTVRMQNPEMPPAPAPLPDLVVPHVDHIPLVRDVTFPKWADLRRKSQL